MQSILFKHPPRDEAAPAAMVRAFNRKSALKFIACGLRGMGFGEIYGAVKPADKKEKACPSVSRSNIFSDDYTEMVKWPRAALPLFPRL